MPASASASFVPSGSPLALVPGSIPALGITCYGILSIGMGLVNTLIFALQADTAEYGEWTTGVRGEASVYSVLSFTRKAGQGVGGAAASFMLGLGGYVSAAVIQTPEAITAVKIAVGIIPAAILIGGLIMFDYPLTEDVFRRIIREIAARRERQSSIATTWAAG